MVDGDLVNIGDIWNARIHYRGDETPWYEGQVLVQGKFRSPSPKAGGAKYTLTLVLIRENIVHGLGNWGEECLLDFVGKGRMILQKDSD